MVKVHEKAGEIFRRNMRATRERMGISRGALAGLTGLSEGYLYQVERGLRVPSQGTMYRISSALDVEIGSLFKKEGSK